MLKKFTEELSKKDKIKNILFLIILILKKKTPTLAEKVMQPMYLREGGRKKDNTNIFHVT